jgi:hypothetical protein
MEINKDCRLFLKDVYSYDIKSCHYTILEKKGLDVSWIDKTDKLKRNIQIGKWMAKNPRISSLLRNVTNSIIDDYITKNNLKSEEIILRQYDGIIITRTLKEITNQSIPLDLRTMFQIFISSFNRKMYISFDGVSETIKGVPFRYKEMDKIYQKILRINFLNKTSIFRSLQRIKTDFFESKNPSLFCIPTSEGKYNIFLKEYGQVEISKQTLKILSTIDIDKKRYFDFYIKPFTQSIVSEFL